MKSLAIIVCSVFLLASVAFVYAADAVSVKISERGVKQFDKTVEDTAGWFSDTRLRRIAGIGAESWEWEQDQTKAKYLQLRWKTMKDTALGDSSRSSLPISGLEAPDLTVIYDPDTKHIVQIDLSFQINLSDSEAHANGSASISRFRDSVLAAMALVSPNSVSGVRTWLNRFAVEDTTHKEHVDILNFGKVDIAASKVVSGFGNGAVIAHTQYENWRVFIVPANYNFLLRRPDWEGWGKPETTGSPGIKQFVPASQWARFETDILKNNQSSVTNVARKPDTTDVTSDELKLIRGRGLTESQSAIIVKLIHKYRFSVPEFLKTFDSSVSLTPADKRAILGVPDNLDQYLQGLAESRDEVAQKTAVLKTQAPISHAETKMTLNTASAKEIWEKSCAKCHGADGTGNTKMGMKFHVKDYTKAKAQAELKEDTAIKAIKEGLKHEQGYWLMKPSEDLSDDNIKALVAYMRKFKK